MNRNMSEYQDTESNFNPYQSQASRSPQRMAQNASAASIGRAISPENATNETLDRKFVTMMLEIEKRYQADDKLQKHEKIRIEQWVSEFKFKFTLSLVSQTVPSHEEHPMEAEQEPLRDLAA